MSDEEYIEKLENNWEELKKWLKDYEAVKIKTDRLDKVEYRRYCIAISVEDILNKMNEIEGEDR